MILTDACRINFTDKSDGFGFDLFSTVLAFWGSQP